MLYFKRHKVIDRKIVRQYKYFVNIKYCKSMINPKGYSPLIRGNINGPVWFQRRPVGGSLLFSNTKEEIRVPLRKRTCQSTSAQLKQKHVQKIKNYCVFNSKMDTLRRGMEFTKRQAPGPLTPTQFNQLLLNGFLKVL